MKQCDTGCFCSWVVLERSGCVAARSHGEIEDFDFISRLNLIDVREGASLCLDLVADLLHHLVESDFILAFSVVGSMSLILEMLVSLRILPSLFLKVHEPGIYWLCLAKEGVE